MNDLALPHVGGTISPNLADAASVMAQQFQERTGKILDAMDLIKQETAMLSRVFDPDDGSYYNGFSVDFQVDHQRLYGDDDKRRAELLAIWKRTCWELLANKLGIKNVMSVAKRKKFEEQLRNGDLPDISADTIKSVIMGLVEQARDFAKEAAMEVFEILRPKRSGYATNNAFKIGKRVILRYRVERSWGIKYRVNYHYQQQLVAIESVFRLMDGKGVIVERSGQLIDAIENTDDGRGETDYFRFKCFKNRNLHLEFKRLDLVKQLNGLGTGDYSLGHEDIEV